MSRHRARSDGARVRRRSAVPAAHRQRLAGRRHQQAAAGPARRAGAARGCGGESDTDLRAGHADHHVERCDRAGVGSRSARCGQRQWGQRPRAAHGALGAAGEPDLAREPVRAHARGPWAAADHGRGADRRRRDRHGLQDDCGQRPRAGQARGAADRRGRGVARRAAGERVVARRDLPLSQPRQRHGRSGDDERAASRTGRAAPERSIRAAPGRGRRSTSTAGCSAARCHAAASRSC